MGITVSLIVEIYGKSEFSVINELQYKLGSGKNYYITIIAFP